LCILKVYVLILITACYVMFLGL